MTAGTSVLVTGGAGFLGSHVAERLLDRGHRVVVLDDLSGGFRRNVPRRAIFRKGSIIDDRLVDGLFAEYHFEHVFHLAAWAAEVMSHHVRRHNYTVNLLGSINLINAAVRHEVGCFVFTSSIAVYGDAGDPFPESSSAAAVDPYGIAKQAVERDLAAARDLFGMRSIVFRPHNVYGERQNLSDPYRNVVGIFMNQVLRGRPCTIFGDGSQTRAFSYVGDVAGPIAESVDEPNAYDRAFNIGAGAVVSVEALARQVQLALGRDTGVEFLPRRHEADHVSADHSRFDDCVRRSAGHRPEGRAATNGPMGSNAGTGSASTARTDRDRAESPRGLGEPTGRNLSSLPGQVARSNAERVIRRSALRARARTSPRLRM